MAGCKADLTQLPHYQAEENIVHFKTLPPFIPGGRLRSLPSDRKKKAMFLETTQNSRMKNNQASAANKPSAAHRPLGEEKPRTRRRSAQESFCHLSG